MRSIWAKRAGWAIIAGTGLAGLVWFAWPQPVPVDLSTVTRGPMEVTVDDDGKTNVRHIYTVSATDRWEGTENLPAARRAGTFPPRRR